MATKEESNVLYTNVMPLLGVVVSALGVTLSFLLILHHQAQAAGVAGREPMPISSGLAVKIPRAHYEDGQVFVEVRNPGEWHDIRDFVQPTNPDVISMLMGMPYG